MNYLRLLLCVVILAGCGREETKKGEVHPITGQPMPASPTSKIVLPQNEMTIQAYKALAPREPKNFTLMARLSDFFNYDFSLRREEFLSIELREQQAQGNGIFWGYIPKGTPLERLTVNVLKDGKHHPIAVTVQHTGENPNCVMIIDASIP